MPAVQPVPASMSVHVPAKRLAGFYFWYFAAIGALIPYLGLYLQARGFGAAQIGAVAGILAATRIFSPLLWGWLADHGGRRMRVVLVALAFAALCFELIPWAPNFTALAVLIAAYGLFINGTMPQFEVVTFNYLAQEQGRYARIRLWGSVGFVVTVLGLGPVFDHLSILTLPYWICALFALAWLIGLRIPEAPVPTPVAGAAGMLETLRRRPVIVLLLACLLAQVSYGPYYSFFSIYLEQNGYSKGLIGMLWALGVVAEIAVFWVMTRLLKRMDLRLMLLWALAVTGARWVLQVAVVDSPWLLAALQLTHAVSFGVYHFASISMIQREFPGRLQGRGVALYTGISYGIGGSIGGFASGFLWEATSPAVLWISASVVGVIAWLLAWRGLRPLNALP